MSRSRSILKWARAGFATMILICGLPGCERTISDEDFEPVEEDPEPTANPTPTPEPPLPEAPL